MELPEGLKIMENDIVMHNMTLEDIEKFFVDAHIRRSKQFGKEYLYYGHIMCGCFDVYASEEEYKKDHDILKSILMGMVERGIFEKSGHTYKLIS
jgi:hypothetical protein